MGQCHVELEQRTQRTGQQSGNGVPGGKEARDGARERRRALETIF